MWIGVDLVTISRAETFITKSPQVLSRFFHSHEIEYASHLEGNQKLSYFAACFAAKEAFYKAFCQFLVQEKNTQLVPSLWRVARHLKMHKHSLGLPLLDVNSVFFGYTDSFDIRLSYSHEKDHLVAIVLLIKK